MLDSLMWPAAVADAPPRAWRRGALALVYRLAALARDRRTVDGAASAPDSARFRPARADAMPSSPLPQAPMQDGPRALVDDLYARHARGLLGYLYHRLPSPGDAEDVLADVFLAALHACSSGETPGPGWLMVVARRRVADFYRERHRQPPSEGELLAPETLHDPEWLALRAEERRELLALVAQLPDEQRDVLSLRFAGGLRSAQIAELIGKTDEATRALLSRAVRRLRKEWTR